MESEDRGLERLAPDQAIEQLMDLSFAQHGRAILRNCRVPASELDDLIQEALIAAYGQVQRGRFPQDVQSLRRWWVGVVRHKGYDYWRARTARTRHESTAKAVVACMAPADQELRIRINESLARLPVVHRRILELSRIRGYSPEVIGVHLKKSASRVSSILAEVRRILVADVLGTVHRPRRKNTPGGILPHRSQESSLVSGYFDRQFNDPAEAGNKGADGL